MKLSAKVILATFNKSKSGKSLVRIEGDTMTIVNGNIGDMCKDGSIEEVEFVAGQDLMDQADPSKVAFKTMQVKDFTASVSTRLAQASAICAAYDNIDTDKLAKAQQLAATLVF